MRGGQWVRYTMVRNEELLSLFHEIAISDCLSERQRKRLSTKLETLIRI